MNATFSRHFAFAVYLTATLCLTSCNRALQSTIRVTDANAQFTEADPAEVRIYLTRKVSKDRVYLFRLLVEGRYDLPEDFGPIEVEESRPVVEWNWFHDGLLGKLWLESPLRLITSILNYPLSWWDPNAFSDFLVWDLIARLANEGGRNQLPPTSYAMTKKMGYGKSLLDWTTWANPFYAQGFIEYQVSETQRRRMIDASALSKTYVAYSPRDVRMWVGDKEITLKDFKNRLTWLEIPGLRTKELPNEPVHILVHTNSGQILEAEFDLPGYRNKMVQVRKTLKVSAERE